MRPRRPLMPLVNFSTSALQLRKTFRQRLRTLGIESLESRRLLTSTPIIIDNNSPSPLYVQSGNWTTSGPNGFGGSSAVATSPFTGDETATWFFDVSPGVYRVAATWKGAGNSFGLAVPVTLYDGDEIIVDARLNQAFWPDDFVSEGTSWENIGTYTIEDSLRIVMTDNSNAAAIADAFRVEQVQPNPVTIVDNSSAGFSKTGTWSVYSGAGYAGNFAYPAAPYTGNESATWAFNVAPGTYRIAATWHFGHAAHASNVPITIYDNTTPIGTAVLNQRISPDDFSSGNIWWEDLGVFTVGASLSIKAIDNVDGMLIADAFRVERIETDAAIQIVDNASSAFATTGTWSSYTGAGYAGTFSYPSAPYTGSDTATWSFVVSPGTYRVSASWHGGHPAHASNVPISVYDGNSLVGSAVLNQRVSPNDFFSQSAWWENIGTFSVWNNLQIRTSDIVDGMLIADAFRIERVSNDTVPIAVNDSDYFISIGTDLVVSSSTSNQLLANDLAHDGLIATAILQSPPTNGTLLNFDSQGGFTYRPNPSFIGVDTFSYQVQGANREKSTATVSIAVGTPLLPRKNLDSNVLNASMPDAWLQMSLLDMANPSPGLGNGYANIPVGSSAGTDGTLAATGGLLLMEDVAQDTNLIYRSDSLTRPIITVDTQLAPGLALPTAMSATLTFAGVASTPVTYTTTGLNAGQALRFAVQADGTTLPTGMYDYTLTVNLTSNGVPVTQSFSGKQAIVNRVGANFHTEFGSGWGLDGLDRLFPQSGGALVVRGNGDSYWFPLVSGVYTHAAGDISHSQLKKLPDNSFTLTSKYGIVSAFSALGLLTSRVDSNGNTITYAYASKDSDSVADELVSITDALGRTTTFNYSGALIANIQHYSGKQTLLEHTGNDLTSYTLTDPDITDSESAPKVSFAYTTGQLGFITQLDRTDAVNRKTEFHFVTDEATSTDSRLRRVNYPDGSIWRIVPQDVVALVATAPSTPLDPGAVDAQITDERQNVWKFRTDRFGAITQSTTPLGNTRQLLRDRDGLLHTFIEPDPDGAGELLAPITRWGYNSTSDMTFHQDATGGTMRMAYTPELHRLARVQNPVGDAQSLRYNSLGNLIISIDGGGFTTFLSTDTRGRTTQIVAPDPDGAGPQSASQISYVYNASGDLTQITNPDGSTQTFTYNTANQLLTAVDELGKVSSFAYDALGRRKSSTNRVQAVTQWQYDAASQLTKEIDPLLNLTEIEYTPRGWVDKITYPDPDGSGTLDAPVNEFSYFANGLLESEGDAGGYFQGQIPYTYDADDRLKTVGNSVDAALETYHYDFLGRVASVDRPPGSGTTSSNSQQTHLSYDAQGRIILRLSQQVDIENGVPVLRDIFRESFAYDAAGRLISTTDGNDNVSTNQYDGRGLLIRQSLPDPDGNDAQFPLVVKHQYDNMGRLIATDRGFGRVTQYEYNNRSWLTKAIEPDPDGAGPATSPTTHLAYNQRGDQTSITDPMNRITGLVYDDEQRLTFQVDPDPDGSGPLIAGVSVWSYNANNWLQHFSNAIAATTFYQYDALGRVKNIYEPDPDGTGPLASPQTQYVYNAGGLEFIVDPLGRTTTYARDQRGRVASMIDTAGNTTAYTYDYYDNLRTQTAPDPDGPGILVSPVTTFEYDGQNRLSAKIEPSVGTTGAKTKFTYDLASNLETVTDPMLNVTTYVYNNLNQLKSETNQLGESRKYTYNVAGNLVRSTDRNGRVIEYQYDQLDRQTKEIWKSSGTIIPTGTVTTLQDGHKISEQQIVGWVDQSTAITTGGTFTLTHGSYTTAPIPYNASDATIQAALAALPNVGQGNVSVAWTETSHPQDFSNHKYKLTFRGTLAGQNVPQTTINTSSLVVTPSQPLTITQQTTVQGTQIAEQQRIHFTLPGWNTATGSWYLAYAGEVSNPISPYATAATVAAELNQFAGIDNVTVTGGSGLFTITFGGSQASSGMQEILMDVTNLAQSDSGAFDRSFSNGYNAVGELLSVAESNLPAYPTFVRNMSFTRDNLGRATNITTNHPTWNLATVSLTQKFDAVGNRTELLSSLDGTPDIKNTYAYDKLNRLTEVTQAGQAGATWVIPKRVTQEYNALGQRTKMSRFESLSTANPVATTDFSYDFANRLGSIAHKQGTTNLNTYNYVYDPLSRLSSVSSTADGLTNYTYDQRSQLRGVDNALYPDESFAYDEAGNRNSSGYTTPLDNRTATGDGWTYTYDDEGNVTQANHSGSQQYWTYTWDHRNRLVKAVQWNGPTIDYEYDAFNRLIRRNETHYIYDDGINPIMETSSTDNSRKYYLWSDAVDDLLATQQLGSGGTAGNVLWPLADHLGSIRDIADRHDTTGVTSVANHRVYDAFGQLQSETNAAVDLVFGYTGKLFDEATGLQNNLNRWYNPRLGKFISQDPIGFAAGDVNLYRYVGNQSTRYLDPLGLADEVPVALGGTQTLAVPVFTDSDVSVYWPTGQRPAASNDPGRLSIGACDPRPMTAENAKQLAMLELQYQIRQALRHGRSTALMQADLMKMRIHPAAPALPLVWFGPQDAGYGTVWDGLAFVGGFAPGMNPMKTAAGANYPYRVGIPTNNPVATAPLNFVAPNSAATVFRVQGGVLPNASKIRFALDDAGKIAIRGDEMLFINVNQQTRALEFLAKRGEGASLVQFQIKPEFLEKLRSLAVPQRAGRQFPGRPQLVDPTRAPDQFGIPSNMFDELLENIIPGTGGGF